MKILFVCKHNRFRSKVAEAIFLNLNKDKNIEVKSAGIQIDFQRPYIAGSVKNIMKEKGYEVEDEKPRIVDKYLIDWADKIVIVADNVDSVLFKGFEKKTEVWKVEDTYEEDVEGIKKIVDKVEERVKDLVKRIK